MAPPPVPTPAPAPTVAQEPATPRQRAPRGRCQWPGCDREARGRGPHCDRCRCRLRSTGGLPAPAQARVLAALRAGATTSVDVAAAAGLTRHRAHVALAALERRGLVRRAGAMPSGGGRPPVAWEAV